MKKIFTLAAAVLTALTMNAQTTVFLWQYDGSSAYGDGSTNGVFDVADNANGIVKFVTYEKKKTSADGTSAYAATVTDDDLKPSITKVCKLGNNGAHLRISPATGNFQAGDTIYICGYKDFIVSTSSDPTSTAKITTEAGGAVIIASSLATGDAKGSCAVGSVVLPDSFVETNEIYISRANGNSAGVAAIKVVRPETKTIISTVETLTGVTINDVAISATDLASLVSSHTLTLENSYITAPVIKFTKHTVITYEDQSTKVKDEVIEVTSQQSTSTTWGAYTTIGETAYTVYTVKTLSYTVTYLMMDGQSEIVLGTELVAVGEHPAEYAQYEVRSLYSFNAWYDEDYIEEVDMTQVVVNEDMSFYADFDKAYAQSIDFEQMVLNQGKSYDVKSALTANFYDYKTIDALDSLNNSKGATRNEPYLGLKIKKNGGYLACNVLPGTTLRIKFGYVGDKVLAIAGNDTMPLNPTDNKLAELTVPFMIEKLVKLQTTSDKTVVIKQIMIDEPLVTWMYPITYAEAEHGTVSGWTIAFPDEEVKLSFTMDEGYTLVSCYANEQAVVSTPNVGEFFTMPAEAVTVTATFGDIATGMDNTEATVKAVKVVRNGQLFIEKNGVLYNAQGSVVK